MSIQQLLNALCEKVGEASLYRFCQLLENASPHSHLLGSTENPADDPVRFRPDPGMGFPVSELKVIEISEAGSPAPPTVRTKLLGLYGVDSPLPTAYLDDIAQRREGHEAVEAFLDIFNHRIFTQFYRIWRKYSYPATFEAGGADATSQCLLGLIGLGISGCADRIATPISRLLALLGVMRLPTRTTEGVVALVQLIACDTQVQIARHSLKKIPLSHPATLCVSRPVMLSQGTPLGPVGWDVNSELLLTLRTDDRGEALEWFPGGRLHLDLMALLRAYLGWRCTVKIQLCLPVRVLPAAALGAENLRLGMNAVVGLKEDGKPGLAQNIDTITINSGRYQGLRKNPKKRDVKHVDYRF